MNKTILSAALIAALGYSSSAAATSFALVTNGDNDGAGSLRAALTSGANVVRISRSVASISVTEPLTYDGERRLKLVASGQTIDASGISGNGDIFAVTAGADLSLSNLNFIGNAVDVNPDANTTVGGKGIFVNVPESRQGVVRVTLDNVSVSNVGNHGIHVSDCTLRDECGGGSGGGGEGSLASVYVKLNDVTVNNVGFGTQDADGVRVDERGDGDIYFSAWNSSFLNVGADGIELDEGNNGDVVADVSNSLFDSNGEYCLAVPFVAGNACDDEGDPDVDDGFDIDEAGPGSLYARVQNTQVTNNFDEGLDFDEEDEGSIVMRVNNVLATGNEDEGIKASEEDEGSLRAALRRVTLANNNGSKEGVELEEANDGDVSVRVSDSTAIGGADEALKVEQTDEGNGRIKVRNSNIDELDLEGVTQL